MTDTVRIDKWLWAARFFKTRSLASAAVESGKVRINGDQVKPARNLKPGDLVDIDNGSAVWEVRVVALAEVRRSAVLAQALYGETEKSIARRLQEIEQRKFYREPGTTLKGRPTKRNRRLLDSTNLD